MKRVFIIFILLLDFFIGLILLNDYSAYKVEKALLDIPVPLKTEVVDSIFMAGKLNGNGNGMQYFGAILLKSELSLEELDSYYQDFQCNVEEQKTSKIIQIEHENIYFYQELEYQNCFIVYRFGEGIALFGLLDLRGN